MSLEESNLIYRERRALTDGETDAFGLFKPCAVALSMQYLAEAHAVQYGNGRRDLLKTGAVWALARTKVRFCRLPEAGEELEFVTWPGKLVRNLFPRYYAFDYNGESIGSAVTLWMLVDAKTHQATLPERHGVLVTGDPVLPPPFAHPVRIRERGEPLFTLRRRCQYSDLDGNGHMNNARYLEWMCDAINPKRTPAGFQVNYLSEIRPGEEAELLVFEGGVVVGVREDGERAFEGILEL